MTRTGAIVFSCLLTLAFSACGSGPRAGASSQTDAGPGSVDAGTNGTDAGPCAADEWVGTYSGPASSTTTIGATSHTIDWTATVVVTSLPNCQIKVDNGGSYTTNHGSVSYSEHTLTFNVSGNAATVAGAQPFAGTENYDGAAVTFAGQAQTGTATLSGSITAGWQGIISGTTNSVAWSGTYTASSSLARQ